MSKLMDDPKVAKLVESEVAKALKAERKRTLDLLKQFTAEVKQPTPFDND